MARATGTRGLHCSDPRNSHLDTQRRNLALMLVQQAALVEEATLHAFTVLQLCAHNSSHCSSTREHPLPLLNAHDSGHELNAPKEICRRILALHELLMLTAPEETPHPTAIHHAGAPQRRLHERAPLHRAPPPPRRHPSRASPPLRTRTSLPRLVLPERQVRNTTDSKKTHKVRWGARE
eukprot:COSAG01_NODE_2612_length_7381_cov_11.186762_2_plen_179_part_00